MTTKKAYLSAGIVIILSAAYVYFSGSGETDRSLALPAGMLAAGIAMLLYAMRK